MKNKSVQNLIIMEMAAEWAVLMDESKLSEKQNKDLAHWLLESPVHIKELLLACTLFDATANIDPKKRISLEALMDKHSSIIPLNTKLTAALTNSKRKRLYKFPALGLAATVLVSLLTFTLINNNSWFNNSGYTKSYVTARGEQRNVLLEDGSYIYLNTLSEIEVDFSFGYRNISLKRGEAIFKVAHDTNRPFRVWVKDVMIQAIGTEFNVRRKNDAVELMVIAGKVALLKDLLPEDYNNIDFLNLNTQSADSTLGTELFTVGQGVSIDSSGQSKTNFSADLKKRTSWIAQQLIFSEDSLTDVIIEFNRYNNVQISLDDNVTENLPITGVFNAHDPNSLLDFLQNSGKFEVRTISHNRVMIFYVN